MELERCPFCGGENLEVKGIDGGPGIGIDFYVVKCNNCGAEGSSFDNFLLEEGIFEETTRVAVKRVIAWQIEDAMKQKKISKSAMAKEMKGTKTITDKLGNRADVAYFGSEKEARTAIRTLKNCTGCVNCIHCVDCIDCRNCVLCTDCVDCLNVSDAYDSEHCQNCTHINEQVGKSWMVGEQKIEW